METSFMNIVPVLGVIGLFVCRVSGGESQQTGCRDRKMRYLGDQRGGKSVPDVRISDPCDIRDCAVRADRYRIGNWVTAVCFVVGALFPLAGYCGMTVATKANVRTANARTKRMNQALSIAFSGGAVMECVYWFWRAGSQPCLSAD